MIPTRVSVPEEWDLPIPHSVPQEVSACTIDFVRCFRCKGAECPKCGGSGFREQTRCVGCRVPTGRPSQGGKALSPKHGAKSWEELRSLPLYCILCNPRFFKAGLALFDGMVG